MNVLLLDELCQREMILLAVCRMGQMRGDCGRRLNRKILQSYR